MKGKTIFGLVAKAALVLCLTACDATPRFDADWSVQGKRIVTINSIIRVGQIEVTREHNVGNDESDLHTVEAAERFRKAVSDAIPEAKITWSFSWMALHDMRPNYVALREKIVEYHKQYGDEITFIPGAYFAPMYNPRRQVNEDMHDALQIISDMVGGGYRPHGIVAGFLAADNLRYLAEEEDIHVAQGTIWSQYGIDNGDGDGSISYPYYPSREHVCKPAQGKDDFIDCVNLDGWTTDFLCARRYGFEDGANSRLGIGPIESYYVLGPERGLQEVMAVTHAHFDTGVRQNGFGWLTVNWELSLVPSFTPEVTDCLTQWLRAIRAEWPDAMVPLMSEFGEAWRHDHPDNAQLHYHFTQRGTGVEGAHSEPNLQIDWYMNQAFRLALLHDVTQLDSTSTVIDFTRYDLPAHEPADASFEHPSRNWSLINRINQKRRRPEDEPIPFDSLTTDEKAFIASKVPSLK